jgi:TIR domain
MMCMSSGPKRADYLPAVVRVWAQENGELLDLIAGQFLRDGRWPSIGELTRRLAREDRVVPVRDALRGLPPSLGAFEEEADAVLLSVFGLCLAQHGERVLVGVADVMRVAIERFRGTDDHPTITRADLKRFGAGDDKFIHALSDVLIRDAPFLGSGRGGANEDWTREITEDIVRYWDAQTAEDYLRIRAKELFHGGSYTGVPSAITGERADFADGVRDAFISHASEDKETVARPLAEHLRELGHSLWFDEHELVVGDSLSESIDRGLSTSRFGVVILSHAFFAKQWPRRELRGLVAKEVLDGERVILPVWHDIDARDVARFSPPLADVLAARTSDELDDVARRISRAINVRKGRPARMDFRPPELPIDPGDHPVAQPTLKIVPAVVAHEPPASISQLPSRRTRMPSRTLRLLGIAAFTGFVTALAGVVVAPDSHSANRSAPLVNSASFSGITVSFPTNWRSVSAPVPTSGLRFSDPVTLTSSYSDGALVLGMNSTGDRTLLPASLLALLAGSPKGEVVRLGDAVLYRYKDLRPRGAAVSETVYALPTTAGIVVAACMLSPLHARTVGVECEHILSSLRLSGSQSLPLGPQRPYEKALAAALSVLDTAQQDGNARLDHASTAAVQAYAAGELQVAYLRAAKTLRRASPGPVEREANAALISSLSRLANGYASMSAAARSANRGAFDSGRKEVNSAMGALGAARSQLSKAGYDLAGG